MVPPEPQRPGGGMTILLLLVLAVILGALLIWGYLHANPGRPDPAATARPATMPAGGATPSR